MINRFLRVPGRLQAFFRVISCARIGCSQADDGYCIRRAASMISIRTDLPPLPSDPTTATVIGDIIRATFCPQTCSTLRSERRETETEPFPAEAMTWNGGQNPLLSRNSETSLAKALLIVRAHAGDGSKARDDWHARIGEEIAKVPKGRGPGRAKIAIYRAR
jgi:hypothetical protein